MSSNLYVSLTIIPCNFLGKTNNLRLFQMMDEITSYPRPR